MSHRFLLYNMGISYEDTLHWFLAWWLLLRAFWSELVLVSSRFLLSPVTPVAMFSW